MCTQITTRCMSLLTSPSKPRPPSSATEAAVLATIIHKRQEMHSPGNRNITVLATIIGFNFKNYRLENKKACTTVPATHTHYQTSSFL